MRELACDVAVIGGGPAGVAAAVSSQRAGAKAVLIERAPFFGGNATAASVAAFCGFYTRGSSPDIAVAGIGGELLERMKSSGDYIEVYLSPSSGNTTVKFEPEEMKLALDSLVLDSGVSGYLHAALVSVETNGEGKIDRAVCSDDEGLFAVRASQYVDATGNATLIHFAGGETVWGDDQGAVQQVSLVFRLEGLPRRDVAPSELKAAIVAGKEADIEHLAKEGGVIIKAAGASFGYCTVPSTVLEGLASENLTKAERELRKQVRAYTEAFRRFIPDFGSCHVAYSGPVMGLRESRRIVGETRITGEAILAGYKKPDSIARAAWSPEIHKGGTNPKFVHIADNNYASIPLGALICRGVNNAWIAGRAIASDPLALASVRVMGTSMATGHAAGVAAALSLSGNRADVAAVQKELKLQGALI